MKHQKLLAVVGAVLLATMAISGGVMAASPSLDTETTDTSTTTELDGTSTQTYNESTASDLNYSQDSNQTEVTIYQGSATDGRELVTYDNTSDVLEFDSEASGTYYWSASFADDAADYTGIEADAGESVDVTAQLTNLGDDPETYNNVTFTFQNDDNVSFANANDSETKVADTTGTEFRSAFSLNDSEDDAGTAEVEEESIGVNGDNQDEIVLNIENADAQASATEVFDANEDAESPSTLAIANVEGESVMVFAEGQDTPEWFDEDENAYVTVSDDGQTATVQNAGELLDEDDTEADITLTANDKIGFNEAFGLARNYDASRTEAVGLAVDSINLNGSPDLAEA